MKKNNKPAAKRYMKTVGMVMASVMVLSSTTGQMVYAESAKDQKDTQDGEKKEEKTIVYLNGKTGNDKNSGESQDEAVKSFEKAAADDKSAPLMDNAQKVYAGMTYGKGRLTESFINDDNRGFLA